VGALEIFILSASSLSRLIQGCHHGTNRTTYLTAIYHRHNYIQSIYDANNARNHLYLHYGFYRQLSFRNLNAQVLDLGQHGLGK
jgi:hypothetical protein